MKTLIVLAALVFFFFRTLKNLGRFREMERHVYSDADSREDRPHASKKKTGTEGLEIPA